VAVIASRRWGLSDALKDVDSPSKEPAFPKVDVFGV
jgi:hypothetical protein